MKNFSSSIHTNDEETLVNRTRLRELVRTVFSRQLLSAAPQFFCASVESEDQFAREAAQLLTALRIKVLERASLLRPNRQRGDHQT